MARQEIEPNPQPEILGTVKPSLFAPGPQAPAPSVFLDDDGVTVQVADPPPPWEVNGASQEEMSDARKFVQVPKEWALRWINPKTLDQFGWRYWEAVSASDPRVKVLVKSMVHVDNTIRRGGQTGDILAWMYQSWVDKRREMNLKAARALADTATNRFQQTQLKSNRYVTMEQGIHPTHTLVDGREMRARGD